MRRFIDLDQRTPEWLNWRRAGIGASDASVLVGKNKFGQTPRKLWLEKTGQAAKSAPNYFQNRGNALEPQALAAVNQSLGTECVPACFESVEHPFLKASLDGWDPMTSTAVEVKCPGEKDHAIAMKGSIPESYVPQLQQQMAVMDIPCMWYASYRPEEKSCPLVLLELDRDLAFWADYLPKAQQFWEQVLGRIDPDAPLFLPPQAEQWAQEFVRLKHEIEALNAKKEAFAAQLHGLLNGQQKTVRVGPVIIRQDSRKGMVEFDKIPQLAGINLDSYRKPGTLVTTIALV